MALKIKVKGTTVKVIAGADYTYPGSVRVKVRDTGKGFIAKFPEQYTDVRQDHYVCLDYAQANDLYQALKEYDKMGSYFGED